MQANGIEFLAPHFDIEAGQLGVHHHLRAQDLPVLGRRSREGDTVRTGTIRSMLMSQEDTLAVP